MAEGGCVVVAVQSSARLGVEDGESTATKSVVNLCEQSLCAVREFLVGWPALHWN